MIGTSTKPARSRPARIAPTRPSIMSDGATMSAPARACASASFTSGSRLASFATSPFSTMPQCPWSVYSQRQTSVTTSSSGSALLIASTARTTIPSAAYAPEPIASLRSGMRKMITAGTPRSNAALHSSTARSSESCATHRIAATGCARLLVLLVAAAVGHCARGAYAAGAPSCADPNGDGVDVIDAANVLRAAVGLPSTCASAPAACDLDGAGGIDREDALDVLRRAVGLAPTRDCLPHLQLTEVVHDLDLPLFVGAAPGDD